MKLTFTFLILICGFTAFSQTYKLSGTVSDRDGKPVPFVSIYVKNTSVGTSANSNGEYSLRLNSGNNDLIFKAIGFKQESKSVLLNANTELNVQLQTEVYELKDVVIKGGGEDPAYEIIRRAIKKRKTYLNEVNQFTAEVYIKGLQKLLAAPKKFLGKDIGKIGQEIGLDSNRQGIIYLSESESKLSYIKPDKFREVMLSSKVSGSNRAFSFNRASDIKVNFYENIQDWEGLSNRPFISPISENALFYYQYKYIGSFTENGLSVNKIQVIPRRNTDPVFSGFIYILEDSWRLHSLDLSITKASNINFVDTLKVNQQFIPVGKNVWMPSSVKFDFVGGLFGFRFGGYFIAVYKNYDLNPNLNLKDFTEVLRIDRDVSKKDSAYWAQVRPVPLTTEEKVDYQKKEILAAKRESKVYLDSLDKVHNKFKLIPFVIGEGYQVRNRFKRENYSFSSLKNSIFYNTVEGFGIDYKVSYSKRIDSTLNKFLLLSSNLRYGVESQKFYGSISGRFPVKETNFSFDIGSDVRDLNDLGSISAFGNTINSLFYERNYLKLYDKRFISLSASRRVSSDVVMYSTIEWAQRKSLQNTTNYTFVDVKDREFTSNNPFEPTSATPLFPNNNSFKIKIGMQFQLGQTYATYPGGKVYYPSKFPLLEMNYTKGFKNILGSDVDFDLFTASLSKRDISLGLYGKSTFYAGVGKFLNSKSVYYTDYKHFIGTQSLSFVPKINNYLFLDYYNYSTSDKFFEGHFEHNFSGFITNKIPLIRKLKLQEIAGINYLSTPKLKNYVEDYFGFQYLNFRVMYGFSYDSGKKVDSGFKIAYGF
ncbi:MAG: DUF5686 and carboxypeptidase regulatory-like domain-containing protein [Daejeonella sp.]